MGGKAKVILPLIALAGLGVATGGFGLAGGAGAAGSGAGAAGAGAAGAGVATGAPTALIPGGTAAASAARPSTS